jgi:hypothetical protein
VKLYQKGKTPDSSTRALWEFYQRSHLVANQDELAREMMNLNLALRIIVIHTSKGSLACRKILGRAEGFTSPPKEGVLRICIALGRV